MRHLNHRTLVDQGRKAGLRTGEIYSAMASRQPEAGEYNAGPGDGNGFISRLNDHGSTTFQPSERRNGS